MTINKDGTTCIRREYVSETEACDIATSMGYTVLGQSRSYIHKDPQSASGLIVKDYPSDIDNIGLLTSILIGKDRKIHFLRGKKFYA